MPDKRSNGEGSVRQRTDGRWEGRIRIGADRRTVYGKTRQSVVDQLQQIRSDAMLGLTVASSRQTVGEYLNDWRERAVHLRPSTSHLYGILIRDHIMPHVGATQLK